MLAYKALYVSQPVGQSEGQLVEFIKNSIAGFKYILGYNEL